MHELVKKWWIFSKERFPLLNHTVLIIFYFSANALVALYSKLMSITITYKGMLGILIVFFIFYHLRIFDEIKDYKVDIIAHKERPIARGLIKVSEAKRAATILILLELCLAILIGKTAFIALIGTVVYSLIMYKEFFIGKWLRPKIVTYALMHTLVSCWISVFIFSVVTNLNFWEIPNVYGMFVFTNWMVFNIFEFGRKTFGKEEEKEFVESYSKRLGPVWAAFNVVVMATPSIYVAFKLGNIYNLSLFFYISMSLLYGLILISAVIYAFQNNKASAKFFRNSCSIFILFYNVIITVGILWSYLSV